MADQARGIFAGVHAKPQAVQPRKDKLAQSKLRERELHEAHRAEVQASKTAALEVRAAQKSQLKEERILHDTKRAAKDKREAERRMAHAATGQECEHGVWRCAICFPHKHGKPRA